MSYIDRVNVGGTTHLIEPTLFAIAAGSSSEYTAAIGNFALVAGTVVHIQISTTNDANVTLNVNSTGAKAIRYEGNNIAAEVLVVDRIYSFVCTYSNSTYYWDLINDLPRDDRIELVDMMEAT